MAHCKSANYEIPHGQHCPIWINTLKAYSILRNIKANWPILLDARFTACNTLGLRNTTTLNVVMLLCRYLNASLRGQLRGVRRKRGKSRGERGRSRCGKWRIVLGDDFSVLMWAVRFTISSVALLSRFRRSGGVWFFICWLYMYTVDDRSLSDWLLRRFYSSFTYQLWALSLSCAIKHYTTKFTRSLRPIVLTHITPSGAEVANVCAGWAPSAWFCCCSCLAFLRLCFTPLFASGCC